MNPDIRSFNNKQTSHEVKICNLLASILTSELPDAENKIWHRHPVWFLDENPIVGYNKLKAGIRLMFWSGASFEDEKLKLGTGKFKDASITYTDIKEVSEKEIMKWVKLSREIQWDYKNIYKRKGKLIRLK